MTILKFRSIRAAGRKASERLRDAWELFILMCDPITMAAAVLSCLLAGLLLAIFRGMYSYPWGKSLVLAIVLTVAIMCIGYMLVVGLVRFAIRRSPAESKTRKSAG